LWLGAKGLSAELPTTQAGDVAEVSARALRVEPLTSALVPHTRSFGSIFRNSFLRGPFVKIVSTKGHFEKILGLV
jgi:hypothetical protein